MAYFSQSRIQIQISGTVQGVGFRPFVYSLAEKLDLKGQVFNTLDGVTIDIEGPEHHLDGFVREIYEFSPPPVHIETLNARTLPYKGYNRFSIIHSTEEGESFPAFPPDAATCRECIQETEQTISRYYGYAFTSCTRCGPRFTIIKKLPYDRSSTAMDPFNLCTPCQREYSSPLDRRFHAQTVACEHCGPAIKLVTGLLSSRSSFTQSSWLESSWNLLQEGKILAVKGLGGFHLVCDGTNSQAVNTLRLRKSRSKKPFAVMCRDLETVSLYCRVNKSESAVLQAPSASVVLLTCHRGGSDLSNGLAPGLNTLGMMLPYTPLHHLLLSGPLSVLVMTSANFSGLPITAYNIEAVKQLGKIADGFLLHNRKIENPCDDSVVRVLYDEIHVYRRARGFVPRPITVFFPPDKGVQRLENRASGKLSRDPVVLGVGGDQNNTFCLLKGTKAVLSQHNGELNTAESLVRFKKNVDQFLGLLGVHPEVIVSDLHPGYYSSRITWEGTRTHFRVQHHHAHLVSCMTENGYADPVVGAVMDGTGYGSSDQAWGFEIVQGDWLNYQRFYHLSPVPLPGGEQAVRYPWKVAVAYLVHFLGDPGAQKILERFAHLRTELDNLLNLFQYGYKMPMASSCGRLFDAVSALIGICYENTYDGQAAIELSDLVLHDLSDGLIMVGCGKNRKTSCYDYGFDGPKINPTGLFQGILDDLEQNTDRRVIAVKFHKTVASMIVEAVMRTAVKTGLETVVLSGGSWQNPFLFCCVKNSLETLGLRVLYHRQIPTGDGGISLGQAVIGRSRALSLDPDLKNSEIPVTCESN